MAIVKAAAIFSPRGRYSPLFMSVDVYVKDSLECRGGGRFRERKSCGSGWIRCTSRAAG